MKQGGQKESKTGLFTGSIAAQPSYDVDFESRKIGRFLQFPCFTGGSSSNGVGGDNLTEYARSRLLPTCAARSRLQLDLPSGLN